MLNGKFISVLTEFFNHIFATGCFPQRWSTGIITPIYKGGSRDEPTNYRGITLLNVIGKSFNSIILSRLTELAEERALIPESQFGFRKNRSTTDCIFVLNTIVEMSLNNRKPLYVCYVDFKHSTM